LNNNSPIEMVVISKEIETDKLSKQEKLGGVEIGEF